MTRSTSAGSRTRLVAALTLTLTVSAAFASDWPQWRGPNRDNASKETGLLQEWPDKGPKLVWKADGLGDGYSTVSVIGDRIYTMGEGGGSSYVHALDAAANGKILWSTKVGKTGGNYEGPRCTPTVDADRVYALGQYGDLVCVNAADGKELWRKNLEKDFKGKMMSGWHYSESPLVDAGRVVCTPGGSDGTMLALDKLTGATLWRCKEWKDNAAYSSIIAADIGGKRTYIQLTDRSVAGVDAETGKLLWRADREGKTAVIPTPVYQDNHVFVTSGYGVGGDLFKITPSAGGKFDVTKVYHTDALKVHVGGVVLVDGHLYGTSDPSILKCIEFLTGKEKWKTRDPGKGAVTYADGNIYVRNEGTPGKVTLVEANPNEYVEKGTLEQPEGSGKNTWPPVVVANGRMYLRDQDVLYCYDVKK
jgi:outer membrane protein assembly factor BamB